MIAVISENRSNVLKRLVSFFIIGFLGLLAELALTAFFIYVLEMQYVIAIGLGFFISLVISYFIFRKYTFKGTERGVTSGLVYFSIIAVGGLCISMGGGYLAVTYIGLSPILARFLLGGVSGLFNFLINLVYNFKVAHVPH